MPLYDYHCHQCGETFEVRQKFADAVLTVHQGCGGELERLISLPALQFKGTGWYITDYGHGRNGKTPATGGNGTSEAKSDSSGESKSESKTDKAAAQSEGKAETKTESKSESKSETKSESKPAPASTASVK